MPLFEVEYSYSVPRYDMITVEAFDIDGAEIKAENILENHTDEMLLDLTIGTIREIK
jgi:hypothetical protein